MNPDPSAARAALAAKHEAEQSHIPQQQPYVPVITAEEVERIKAELAELRNRTNAAEAEAEAANSKLRQYQGVSFGLPQAQPAEPYVSDEDFVPGLNELNASDVVAAADYAGRSNWKMSRVVHRLSNRYTAGRAHTFWYYDEGGFARRIPAQSSSSAMASGLSPVCPICKGYHPESETNPNACPKRAKVAATRCPVCAANGIVRKIYDRTPINIQELSDDEIDVSVMNVPSTPDERLRVLVEQHIRTYHPQTAASMKLQND